MSERHRLRCRPQDSEHGLPAPVESGMKLTAPAQPAEPGPRLSVPAVVTRATSRGSEVLLVRRANPPQPGHWGFPGGKVDRGEGLGQAAIRGLKEEDGIACLHPVRLAPGDLTAPNP